jgi:hypothetical protein
MNRRIRRCRAVVFLWGMLCTMSTAGADEILLTCDAVSAVLGANQAQVRLTLVNRSTRSSRIRLTPPLVARMDEAHCTFVPLRQTAALAIEIAQLDVVLPAGERKTIPVTVRQRATMPAGRYRLAFEAIDAAEGSRLASACTCLTVPPVVQVGQPRAVVIDTVEQASHIEATLRFAVQANIQRITATVSAGALFCERADGTVVQLPLDAMAGVELSARRTLHPLTTKMAFNPATAGESRPSQYLSGTISLASKGAEAIAEDIYVRLYWKRNGRQPLPAGRYCGQVTLLVVPDLKPTDP